MNRISFSSLRIRLLLLVLLAVVPAFGLILYTAWELRLGAADSAKADAVRLARIASRRQRELISAAHNFLGAFAQSFANRELGPTFCSERLGDVLRRHPEYANFGVIGLDGKLLCSAVPAAGSFNLSDREYFRRTVKSQDFSGGGYQLGGVSGKPTVSFGYPVFDRRRNLKAVAFVALDLGYFNAYASKLKLPQGATFLIIDDRGTVVTRDPDQEKWVGKPGREAPIIKLILAQVEGSAGAVDIDGVERLFGFTRIRAEQLSANLYVGIGIATADAYAKANHSLARNLLLLGLAAVLAFFAAWFGGNAFVLRQANALVQVANRLSLGELSARTGISYGRDELGQVARSFDEMAESLEQNSRRMRALREIDQAISSTLDLRAVLNVLLEKIDLVLPGSVTTVRLFNQESALLEPVACRNMPEEEWKAESGREGRGIPNVVFETKTALRIGNVQNDPRTKDVEFFRRGGLVSYLGIPLIVGEEVRGVIGFYTKAEHRFSDEEVEFLTALAGQAVIAINNAQLYEKTKLQAQELERANKVKDEFLSVVSHELRTPLNVIVGYAGMMKDGMLGEISDKQEEALQKMLNRANDQLTMISSILYATQLEVQTVPVERQLVNLPDMFRNLKEGYRVLVDKELTLDWDCPGEIPPLLTDSAKLQQILQNLINNAIKFTGKGRVAVSARYLSDSNSVEFKVADTGVGIPKEAQPFIFDKFHQVDSSETRPYGGVGLGLFIVKEFADLLGGKLGVESAPGRGSVFTVIFRYQS